MKGKISLPGDFVYFKSQVPLHKIPIGSRQWRYYEFGPKVVPPLICLPSIAGTADVYYKQIMALSMKGYHVVSVDIPCVWNHQEWIKEFEKFLDAIDVHHLDSYLSVYDILSGVLNYYGKKAKPAVLEIHRIHLYGTSLGGFLAQIFAEHRPRRVKSLILSNTYLETSTFSSAMPWAPMVSWTPPFLLKRYVLTGIRDGPHEPFIADSVDFVVSQVETLSKDDLASRLSVTVDAASVGHLLLSDSNITIMDTSDYTAISQQLKEQVSEKYPGARRAYLKSGGDFPFLSRSDEVNLHLQLHLGRVGVEPRPDLVSRGIQKDRESASSEEHDDGENTDDKPKEEKTHDADTRTENEPLLLPETADYQNVDSQSDEVIVNNASDEFQVPIAAESLQPLS